MTLGRWYLRHLGEMRMLGIFFCLIQLSTVRFDTRAAFATPALLVSC